MKSKKKKKKLLSPGTEIRTRPKQGERNLVAATLPKQTRATPRKHKGPAKVSPKNAYNIVNTVFQKNNI